MIDICLHFFLMGWNICEKSQRKKKRKKDRKKRACARAHIQTHTDTYLGITIGWSEVKKRGAMSLPRDKTKLKANALWI